jgi:hypothetical protein
VVNLRNSEQVALVTVYRIVNRFDVARRIVLAHGGFYLKNLLRETIPYLFIYYGDLFIVFMGFDAV